MDRTESEEVSGEVVLNDIHARGYDVGSAENLEAGPEEQPRAQLSFTTPARP